MEFIPAVAMLALILKVVDFTRYARNGDSNGVITQLVTWAAGVLIVMLAAKTQWADGIQIGDRPLSVLDIWSQLFAGLSVGSGASVVKDTLKSVDNTNSSAIPTLLPVGPGKTRRNPAGNPRDTG